MKEFSFRLSVASDPVLLLLVQVRMICSAETPISSLFLHQHQDSELEQSRILMDDLGLSQVGDISMISFYYKMV